VALLDHRATGCPEQTAYIFLESGENESARLTYAELARRAYLVAGHLQRISNPGDRALLLFAPGIEFMPAFFGCLCAGIIAVPCYPPKRNRGDERLAAIAVDAQASLVLTSSKISTEFDNRLSHSPDLRGLEWVATDALDPISCSDFERPEIKPDSLAFLQYTSGSTSTPKGVMVSHGNVLHNLGEIDLGFDHTSDSVLVTWLPIFHDMGLIYGVLFPVFHAFPSVMMSPAAFLQRPGRWLQAISRYRGTHNAAPNFAYDLCVDTTTPEQRSALNLRSWRVAVNGAEPVREETLKRFAEAFEVSGFSAKTMCPSYGLAEATLKLAGVWRQQEKTVCWVDSSALAQNRIIIRARGDAGAQPVVSCGQSNLNKIVIVEPQRLVRCPPETVGEIWASGDSIAKGYWNRPEATQETFHAQIADTGEGPFLRTGDLGFLKDGQCFVTGRLKDMIVIRGYNFYPQDIELTVEKSHQGLRPSCAAAFSIEVDGQESLVVVQEVERTYLRNLDADEVITTIRLAVAEKHELQPHAVVLLKPGSIPKTSSGKLQRRACEARWLDGSLEAVAEWRREKAPPPAPMPAPVESGPKSLEAIREWLLGQLSRQMNLPAGALDLRAPFSRYGLNSIDSVQLTTALEQWLGRKLSPTLAYDYPSIHSLSLHLARECGVAAIEGERDKRSHHSETIREPIAIIGAGVRLPGGVRVLEDYWKLLVDGLDAVMEVPRERWELDKVYDPDPDRAGTMTTRFGAFIDDPAWFDARFFEISGAEARDLDPQQRLLLETSWEALESAGQNVSKLRGSRVGVFVGISNLDYARRHVNSGDLKRVGPYALTGTSPSAAAGRISYCFGFEGPSMAVDTACSSSLVAAHLAARSLQAGESSMALAAGVNLILDPEVHVGFSKMRAMAADGRCKTFDAAADGYVRGEGCVVVAMKRLSDALAAGDPIVAVLRGSAVNQDGASNGFTAPNGLAQQAVIRQALADAGVEASSVGYVEAHGTGTPLGDPQEMAALAEVYGPGRPPDKALFVGSVKTNIGHTESAAGLAGLLKAALCVREGAIPPSLHFTNPSPHIPWDRIPVRVPAALETWAPGPRLAGVSSFGFSGTNAHAIVEASPALAAAHEIHPPALLLPLSAKSDEALAAVRDQWIEVLSRPPLSGEDANVIALCRTAALRRAHHSWRLAVAGADRASLLEALRSAELPARATPSIAPKVAFVFPGQGSQWLGMGREMMAHSSVFREAIEECAKAFRPWLEFDLISEELTAIDRIQPALFAFEAALARVWRSFGIEPAAVVGHSMGEIAAAYVAGTLSLEDAARIICRRSALLRRISGKGAMCSVDLSLEEAAGEIADLSGVVSVAVSNAPGSTVLAGDPDAIDRIVARLETRGVFARRIKVDVASHSPQVDALKDELAIALAGIQPRMEQTPICSTVTGTFLAGKEFDEKYWIDNLRNPVLFSQGFETLLAGGIAFVVEMTPHPVLTAMIEPRVPATGTLRREMPELPELYSALGRAWQAGCEIDWTLIYGENGPVVELPLYPWQRERYWIDLPPRAAAAPFYPELGDAIDVAGENTVLRECQVSLWECEWLSDHRIEGAVVFPAAALIELAARALAQGGPVRFENIEFSEPMILTEQETRRVQIRVGGASFSIRSRSDGEWMRHCSGRISRASGKALRAIEALGDGRTTDVDAFYARLRGAGLEYGRAFRLVESLRVSDSHVEAAVARGNAVAFLDCCLQTVAAAKENRAGLWIPAAVRTIVIDNLASLPEKATVRSQWRLEDSADVTAEGVFVLEGLRLEGVNRSTGSGPALFTTDWQRCAPVSADARVDAVFTAPASRVVAAEDSDASDAVREVARLMELVRTTKSPPLRLITRNADADPVQSALRGFFRSVVREYPELRPVAIDLSANPSEEELKLTAADWPDTEPEISIRNGEAFAPRIQAVQAAVSESRAGADEAIEARLDSPGDPDSIAFARMMRRAPGPGEIEIEVEASGLNFLNVLSAFGTYPGYPNGFRSLGIECAGTVTRCGEGVSEFKAGDRVFGIAEHTLASHAIARASLMARNPGIDPVKAAGLPVAYLTAAWSLRHLARIAPDETVLIHSASGGVGRAAMEIARRAGARIVATAGTDAKRSALRAAGADEVFDSRTIDFAESVRADVVLNSLSGDAIEASLRCLKPFGRFVEIGKRDLYGDGRVALENFRAGISYFVVDLDGLAKDRAEQIGALWRELAGEIGAGELNLLPVTEYGFSESRAAFQDMAQAKHSGKIVLARKSGESIPIRRRAAPRISADATYLITGGTGAIGMRLAEWIVNQGGRNIVLLARSAGAKIEKMRAGVDVRVMTCDVSDAGALNRLLSVIERSMPPLAGIVHAAGALADSLVENMDEAAIAKVFAAKVGGALNLHTLTLDAPLDFFIMISSAAGVLGPAGQANYAAANAALDAIGQLRRNQKLPGVAVALGPVAGPGLAASATSLSGLPLLRPDAVAQLIFEAAESGDAHPVAIDLTGFRSEEALFERVAGRVETKATESETRARIRAIPGHQDRLRALEDLLAMHVARLLRCDPASIDADTPFKSLGLDSLMAMQLRNRLNDELNLRLSATAFWKRPTPGKFSEYLAELIEPFQAPIPQVQREASIVEMGEAEAERLLLEKI
jgi:phthiocerol/phenolphthiocerol synthesis type-I polyketide synthase C